MRGSGGWPEDRRMGAYAPQLQKGTCVSCPPTSVGSSSVGPFRFSLTPVNTHPSAGQGTHVLIFNYIVCTESIMAPPGNGSCRQRGAMEYVQNDLVNECISRSLWCVCVCGGGWGEGRENTSSFPGAFFSSSKPFSSRSSRKFSTVRTASIRSSGQRAREQRGLKLGSD